MRLHFNSEVVTSSRFLKIRAVAHALAQPLEEVPHATAEDLSAISLFNTLPLLQTEHGSIFSSNSIVRYLASISGNKLYGNENLHTRALIDQWLDILTCDLEAAVIAVAVAKEGHQGDFAKVITDLHKFLKFINQQLEGKTYLVNNELSIADFSLATSVAVAFESAFGEEERKALPHLLAWYLNLVTAHPLVGSKEFPKEANENFKAKKPQEKKAHGKEHEKKAHGKEEVKEGAKVEAKVEAKKAVEEDDLFGDAPVEAAPKKQFAAKKPKAKPVAKSILIFDVKVFEQEQDLKALSEKIRTEITIDGLVWNNDIKVLPIAYGMNKLQMGCVIEDDKVGTDDIFDKILAWDEEVQSVDTVTFQKN